MAQAATPPLGADAARCAALASGCAPSGASSPSASATTPPGLARAREAARGASARWWPTALAAFHEAARAAGAAQLEVVLGATRARTTSTCAPSSSTCGAAATRRIVTVKSRGEVTLVGPFRQGKDEGPCKSFPIDAEAEIETALGEFLTRFLREAATP